MDKGQAEIQDQIERIPESPQHGDRRAYPRHRPLSLAYVTVGENNGGIVVDVSEGGLGVVAAEALMSGEDLRLCIRPSNPPDPIIVVGRIVWLSPSRKSAGFCFVSPSEQVRQQIRLWIAQELRGAALSERPAARIAAEEKPMRVPTRPAASRETDRRQLDVFRNVPSIAELSPRQTPQPEIQSAATQNEARQIETPAQPEAPLNTEPSAAIAARSKTDEPVVQSEAPAEPPESVEAKPLAPKSSRENARAFPAAGTLPGSGSNNTWLRGRETLFASAPEPARPQASPPSSASEGWWTPLNLGILCAVIVILCLSAGMLAGRLMTGKQIWGKITGMTAPPPPAASENSAAVPPQPATPAQSASAGSPDTPIEQPATAPDTSAAPPDALAPAAPNPPAPVSPQGLGSNPAAGLPAGSASTDTTSMISDTAALVVPPGDGQEPALISFPQEAVAASGSIAIGMTRSVLVAPEPGSVLQHRRKHLVLGKIDAPPPPSELVPELARSAREGARVRLRVTIGTTGDIESMAAIDGPRSLVPTAENIISDWHQQPARLDGRPVDCFENITVSFRPQP